MLNNTSLCRSYFSNANFLYIFSTVVYKKTDIDDIIRWFCRNIYVSIFGNHRIFMYLRAMSLTSSVCTWPSANGPGLHLFCKKVRIELQSIASPLAFIFVLNLEKYKRFEGMMYINAILLPLLLPVWGYTIFFLTNFVVDSCCMFSCLITETWELAV
jgi:hypothetical protein